MEPELFGSGTLSSQNLEAENTALREELAHLRAEISAMSRVQEERNRLQHMVENLGAGVALVDLDDMVIFANAAWVSMHACDNPYEIIGKPITLWHTPEQVRLQLRPLLRLGMLRQSISREVWHRKKDGTVFPTETRLTPYRDAEGQVVAFILSCLDITTRLQTEDKIRQGRKTQSLNLMAGSIAHNFNNILQIILGNLFLLQKDLAQQPESLHLANEAATATNRAIQLSRKMLEYVGQANAEKKEINLAHLVQEAVSLIQKAPNVSTPILLEVETSAFKVHAAPEQIKDAIMELLQNAIEAVEEKTNKPEAPIHVSLNRIESPRQELENCYLCENRTEAPYACIEISDPGCGMPAETLDRAFDPFFSTKFPGRGLGLASVMGIMRGSRGLIQLTSAPNKGTRIQLLLRLSD